MSGKPTTDDRVCDIIGQHLSYFDDGQMVARSVAVGDELLDDLGADSLDLVEVGMALEDEFEIEISDDAIANWKSVGDVVNTVRGLV